MNIKRTTKSTASMLINYLTYEAVKTVSEQLQETDLLKAHWFNQFSSREKIQNGDLYIQELLEVHQELAFRVMTVREHLANEILDFLPEMTRTGIQQSNMQHRCQHLERIMSVQATQGYAECEDLATNLDSDSTSDSNEELDSDSDRTTT
ncbi:chaperonin family protein RbcX [Tumidithrix elongata RA019]|uniref:Chaperonin family protein RbcX n=1 Tax=Tumidithrix elongata BACA0141 TaxID=2716417 RepID=A0AAW9Q4N3_9CYAN|nr:chaperonin family protein RbcX [Tumidithrix elongata RA019]